MTETLKRGPDAVGVSLLLTTCAEPLKRLSHLLREAYQDQPDAPLLFAGCGFMRHSRDDRKELQKKAPQWLGVEQVVTEVDDTVRLCLERVKGG